MLCSETPSRPQEEDCLAGLCCYGGPCCCCLLLLLLSCRYRQPYLSLFLVHAVILLFFALWLVVYGVRLQFRITSHPRYPQHDLSD
jgi:hypothetical protein